MNSETVEEKALWIMREYEKDSTREMYASLEKKDVEHFKDWSSAFFFWLVCITSEKKEIRCQIISKVNEIRNQQKQLLKEAKEHEQELTKDLPEYDL